MSCSQLPNLPTMFHLLKFQLPPSSVVGWNKAFQHVPLGDILDSKGTSSLVSVLMGKFEVFGYLIC